MSAQRARDHRFFTGMAVAASLTAFAGFARTYHDAWLPVAQWLTK